MKRRTIIAITGLLIFNIIYVRVYFQKYEDAPLLEDPLFNINWLAVSVFSILVLCICIPTTYFLWNFFILNFVGGKRISLQDSVAIYFAVLIILTMSRQYNFILLFCNIWEGVRWAIQ